jgi:ribosomal protein S18 acetylase RimI-like enzyme
MGQASHCDRTAGAHARRLADLAAVEARGAGRGAVRVRSRLADWQGDGDREERWRARLGIPGSFNVVATLDGEPAGLASGVPAAEGVAELISMWVSPAARGHGVGEHLVQAVARWAQRAGAGVLGLAVVPGNENAAALYRRNGFHLTGDLGDLMPDGVRREHIMAKDLCSCT